MNWIIGILGFLGGFAFGQVLLMRWLKDKSKAELLSNKDLRYSYGIFNWIMAIVGCLSSLWLYHHFF